MATENDLTKAPDAKVDCLRCSTTMKNLGPLRLRDFGDYERLADIQRKLIELEVVICPNCGKTEFFF